MGKDKQIKQEERDMQLVVQCQCGDDVQVLYEDEERKKNSGFLWYPTTGSL